MDDSAHSTIDALPCWRGKPRIAPLGGGLTNRNFLVDDAHGKFVVRLGQDIPAHFVVRAHELATSAAAAQAGVSPELLFAAPGVMVQRFIEGRTLAPADLRDAARLPAVVTLLKRCHLDITQHLTAPAGSFCVFAIMRGYGDNLRRLSSPHAAKLAALMERADALEQAVGLAAPVFGHNDLLAANFIDDGKRLWLIDWDYAGFNDALFDLGGLASNNEFSAELEAELLRRYFGAVDGALLGRYQAMKTASLLRETLWSMVSELTSEIDFDYAAYTRENLARFEAAWAAWQRK